MSIRFGRVLAAVALLAAVGCGGSTEPASLVGTYNATTFTVIPAGSSTTTNVLTAGGHLNITINADNTTTGQLFIPAGVAGSTSAVTVDMAGSVVRSGDRITFSQSADSFVRDAEWQFSGGTLSTTSTVNGTITVVLTRTATL